jgi:hypothetical protein
MLDNSEVETTISADGLIHFNGANPHDTTHNPDVLLTFGDTPIRYTAWLLTILGLLLFGGRALFTPTAVSADDHSFSIADEWRPIDAIALVLLFVVFAALTVVARLTPDSYRITVADSATMITAATGTPTMSYPAAVIMTTLDSTQYVPGDSVKGILFWRALHPINADWQLVARLAPAINDLAAANLAASPVLVTQWQPGNISTSHWATGFLIRDPLVMTIPVNTAPGSYHVQVALAQCDSPQRLPCERPSPISPTGNQSTIQWLTLPDIVQVGPH